MLQLLLMLLLMHCMAETFRRQNGIPSKLSSVEAFQIFGTKQDPELVVLVVERHVEEIFVGLVATWSWRRRVVLRDRGCAVESQVWFWLVRIRWGQRVRWNWCQWYEAVARCEHLIHWNKNTLIGLHKRLKKVLLETSKYGQQEKYNFTPSRQIGQINLCKQYTGAL